MSIRRHLLTFSWILLGSLCNLGPRQSCITFSQSHQFYSSKRLGLFFWDVPFVIFGSSKSSLLFMPRLIFLLRWYFYVCAEQILSPYIWFAKFNPFHLDATHLYLFRACPRSLASSCIFFGLIFILGFIFARSRFIFFSCQKMSLGWDLMMIHQENFSWIFQNISKNSKFTH